MLPDAAWLLHQVAGRFVVVSNNAEHTPRQLSRLLKGMGLPVEPEQLALAGTAAIDLIAERHPRSAVLLIGSMSLKRYAQARGLCLVETRPDLVLVARDRHFTYAKLAVAAEAIASGAGLIVTNPDGSHPGPDGRPVPETGALAAAIIAVTGLRDYTVIGKPEKALFDMGCRLLGLSPQETLMIGDNPQTDGLGARRLGMGFLQVDRGTIRRTRLAAAG